MLVGGPAEREVGGVRTCLGGALDTRVSIRKHLIRTSLVGLPSQHTTPTASGILGHTWATAGYISRLSDKHLGIHQVGPLGPYLRGGVVLSWAGLD